MAYCHRRLMTLTKAKMKPKNILRVAVFLYWVFLILSIATSFALENTLPEPLKTWLEQQAEADITNLEIILVFIGIPLLVIELIASICLCLLHQWAKWGFLTTTIIGYLLFLFAGPIVEDALSVTLEEISVMLSGLILGLVFFTDVLSEKAEQKELEDSVPQPQS